MQRIAILSLQPAAAPRAARALITASTARRAPTVARLGGRGDGAVLDRPGFLTGGFGSDVQTDSWGTSQGTGGRGTGGGSHRVLLLDSDRHTEALIISAITTTISGTDEAHAANCFQTSRQLGMAIVTTALLEIAEHYAQQLYKQGVRATIEPDSTVI
jgi:ATP-dependent Clp protease adapter protein ClpS